jgi:predicted small lipoprotein YifL
LSRFRPFPHLALIGALAASLALAACGRKGPLESPPGASVQSEPQANNPISPNLMSPIGTTPIGGKAKDDFAGVDASGRAVAPKGQKKQIPLDILLN